jgi:hypothetical protein
MAPWLAEIVMISWRDFAGKGATTDKHLPWPSELLATFILFGVLSLAPAGEWGTAAAAVGWGFVAATFFGIYAPGRTAPATPGGAK